MTEQITTPDTTGVSGTPQTPQISHGEVAGQNETSNDNLIPPGQVTHEVQVVDAGAEIARLHKFLSSAFRDELRRTNRQVPETVVDIAIRLLEGLSASVPPSQQVRCDEEYCNRPAGHTDPHGWIHFQ